MFSFFSCDFGIKENEETNSKEYFTVKGSCSIQGAIPSDLLPKKSIKQNEQRTVVPEIGRTYEITVSFESETGETKSAEVVNKDGVLNFEIELPPGKWTVKAKGKTSDDVIIESESCQIELPAENTNVKLVLKPTQSDTGKGFFKFSFGMETTKVSRMKYTYEKHGATESKHTYTIDDFSAPINKELSSGVYTFRFDFYSDNPYTDELLYSFKEVVNIFDGLTTDTWIGAGEYIKEGGICITENMISQFISTTVYVSEKGNDSNLGTFFEPVKTIQNAVNKVIAMNVDTASSEENPYKILLLSDIYTPSNDSFKSNKALVNIDPSSVSSNGNPLYLKISKCGDGNATINANRSSSDTGRVMYIGENANVTLQNLILTGGYLTKDNGAGLYILNNNANVKIENSEISGNVIDNGYGAGLHVKHQANKRLNLTIENSKISSNTINHNDAVGEYSGAGIEIENVEVTLTITNSEISENVIDQKDVGAGTPEDKGVGLWLGNCATTIISGTDIKNNEIKNAATTNGNVGGGVYLKGGSLTIQNSTEKNTVISGNLSGDGDGVYVEDGTFTMNDGAVISSDNDVFLTNETTITVTGNLTSTDTVATITPNVYSTTRQVLVPDSGVNFTDKIVNRFLVTPENSNEWYVTVDGNLQKMEIDTNGYLGRAPRELRTTPEEETTEDGSVVNLTRVSCLIESYDNMLWIAHELKTSTIHKFDITLTNDIEIPSGKWISPLDVTKASTIDGQGHSIIFNGGSGLFDRFHGGSIENLVLEGTINTNSDKDHFSGQCGVGVLAGSAYQTTIKNVVSTVDVVDTGNGSVGGLIGYFGGNIEGQPGSFIQNCAVYANITSTNGTVGGLVGGTWSGRQCWQINNCIYKGNVTGGTDQGVGAIIGTHNTGRPSTFKDTWYCANTSKIVGKCNNEGNGENFDGYEGTVISKTPTDIASEAAATLLNTTSDGTPNDVWEYIPGSDYPTLKTLSSE